MTTWYSYTICYRCSIVTEAVSPAVCEILSPKHIGATTHVTSLITWRFASPYAVFYWCSIETKPYLQSLASYTTPNISRSRPWPFGVTWRHRACDHFIPPYSISYRRSVVTDSIFSRFQDIGFWTYWGHHLDLSRSRDVIGHMTIRFSICSFLLVLHWNQVAISKRFRDIWLLIYRGHELDLLG